MNSARSKSIDASPRIFENCAKAIVEGEREREGECELGVSETRRKRGFKSGTWLLFALTSTYRELDVTHLRELLNGMIDQIRKFADTRRGFSVRRFSDSAITNISAFYFRDFILQLFHAVEIYGNLRGTTFWQMRRNKFKHKAPLINANHVRVQRI